MALGVRVALAASGVDHGPISVGDRMRELGMPAPSRATLARIFRKAGAVVPSPRKKPRSAWRRFTWPAPNCLWQLDATDYPLTGGRTCTIFQLIDDHSRVAVASHVAWGETSQGALTVVRKGIAARGLPQRLLSDNHASLNPIRRGYHGDLFRYLSSLGVQAITGKPEKPTTQGKNERFHQTLFRWLDARPMCDTLEELQRLVDEFDHYYNTQRRHQALPGRITPQQAWDATPVADPPTEAIPLPPRRAPKPAPGSGHATRTVTGHGVVTIHATQFMIGTDRLGHAINITWDAHTITFWDTEGTLIVEHPRPEPGTKYVRKARTVSDVLRHQPSPKT